MTTVASRIARRGKRVSTHILGGLPGALGAVWAFSAAIKLLDLNQFRTALNGHGLLGAWSGPVSILVPVAELTLAVLGAMCVDSRPEARTRLRGFLAVSSLFVLILTGYVLAVPRETLAHLGCGCHGPLTAGAVTGTVLLGDRGDLLARNAAFFFLHLIAIFGGSTLGAGSPIGTASAVRSD